MNVKKDFVVIGSGIAGLNAALTLVPFGKVLIITKKKITDSSTNFAQGGIAAVTDKKDKLSSHEQDTMKAGVFHNNKKAVQFLVRHGRAVIRQLVTAGVNFEKKATLEAAHSFPRIHHATDFTGREIEIALVQAARSNSKIEIWEHTLATDFIILDNRCFGVQAIRDKKIVSIFSRIVVLATGGIGQVYKWTTNPVVATGDGIAMSYRAGVKLSDLEFVQFHPTALKEKISPLFLLSESLRGEGAHLVDTHGDRFVDELSSRDVVARAIFEKQKKGNVCLDIRHKEKVFLKKRFLNIYRNLKEKGFDLAKNLVPVTPAQHFLCGGIKTDLYGRSSVKNIFAYGEVAATGVHGANRLASNSLLEGMVFSSQIKYCIKEFPKQPQVFAVGAPTYVKKKLKNYLKKKVQEIMWNYVGIERSERGLRFAVNKLKKLEKEIDKQTAKGINEELLETKNIIQTALLIAQAALKRKASLGAHYIVSN